MASCAMGGHVCAAEHGPAPLAGTPPTRPREQRLHLADGPPGDDGGAT